MATAVSTSRALITKGGQQRITLSPQGKSKSLLRKACWAISCTSLAPYYCSLCTQVCPTGAIKELTIEEKIEVKIGSAWIDKNRCIPYALGRPCIVCEEHCPTSPKAIKFVMVETKLPDGTTATQKAPVIDLDLCIGCGICENKCPVMDDPAICCTSVGEDRSEKNRLLLETIEPAGITEESQDP